MDEQLRSLYNEYILAGNSETPEQFLDAKSQMGDDAFFTFVNNQIDLKKKDNPEPQNPNLIPQPIMDQMLGLPNNQIDPRFENTVTQPIQPEEISTELDSTSDQPSLESVSISQNDVVIPKNNITMHDLKPSQALPVINIPSKNNFEFLAGKNDNDNDSVIYEETSFDDLKQSEKANEQEDVDFLKQYANKDYLQANLPHVEKGNLYNSWTTNPADVSLSNENLQKAEANGDVNIEKNTNGDYIKDEFGNYRFTILTDSYKKTYNDYIDKINSERKNINIDNARYNFGNVGNNPPSSEGVDYINQLQKDYGLLFTEDQIQLLGTKEGRDTLEIQLEVEKRLKENPNLNYNEVYSQVLNDRKGLSVSEKSSIGKQYIQDMFFGGLQKSANNESWELFSEDNNGLYASDEQDEYNYYRSYFSNPSNVEDFGEFMNDYGKNIFDSSWIMRGNTQKNQRNRKELFQTFLEFKSKNDRMDAEFSERAFKDSEAKALKYREEGDLVNYQNEIDNLSKFEAQNSDAFKRLEVRNNEFLLSQNAFSKTNKEDKEKEDFFLRVQNGETSANVQNFLGNVILGVENSIQNTVTGVARILATPLGKGNVNDAIDLMSEPLSIGNVDIARISDQVNTYQSGSKTYKEINGVMYEVGANNKIFRPISAPNKNDLTEVSKDREYNWSGIAFVTSKMLSDIYLTQKMGTGINNSISSVANAVSNSKKVASLFGEGSQLANLSSSFARVIKNADNATVSGWYVQMYNDSYMSAKKGGIETEEGRHLYAITTSLMQSLIQRINPDSNFLKSINSDYKSVVSSLMQNNYQKAVLTLQSFGKKAFANTSKELVEENVQQATQDFTNLMVNTIGKKNLQISNFDDYKDVFVGTVIPSIIASTLGGRTTNVNIGDRNIDLTQLTRNELVTELARSEEGVKILQDFKNNAFFQSQEQEADKILSEIKERQKYIDKIPDNEQYSTEAINNVIPILQSIDQKNNALKEDDGVFKERIENEISSLKSQANNILDNDGNEQLPESTQQQSSQETEERQIPEVDNKIETSAEEKITNNPYSLENMQTLPFISEESEALYNDTMNIFNQTNWNDETEVKKSVSEILDLIANKPIPTNKIEQFLESKEKFINSKDYYTPDYIQKYLNLTLRDFSAPVSSVNNPDQTKNTRESINTETLDGSKEPEGSGTESNINTIVDSINNNNFVGNGKNTQISEQSSRGELQESESVYSQEQDFKNRLGQGIREVETQLQRPLTQHEREDVEKQTAFDYAKENNIWIDNLYSLGSYTGVGGNENTLALDKENGILYKSNNLFNSKNSISQFFESIDGHNAIFPNKYTFVGFTGTENKGRTPYIEPIVKQDYIPNANQASQKEIDSYMESIGFEKINNHTFRNDDYTVSDLRPRNVLKDSDGSIHVIDDIVTKNTRNENQENPKIIQSAVTETPVEFKDSTDETTSDIQTTEGKNTNNPKIEIDESIFNDSIDQQNLSDQDNAKINSQLSDAILLFESFNGNNQEEKSIDLLENQKRISNNFIATTEPIILPDGENGFKVTITDDSGNLISDKNGDSEFEFASQDDVDKFIKQKQRGYKLSNNNPASQSGDNIETKTKLSDYIGKSVTFDQFGEEKAGIVQSEKNGRLSIKGNDGKNYLTNSPLVQNLKDENGNVIQLQQSNNQLESITQEEFDALIEKLKKPFKNAFKNLNVTTNLDEAVQKANELGENTTDLELKNRNGNIYGFKLSDGTIYINPDKLNSNTPIHEFSHLWEQLMPNAWKNGLSIFKDTATGKRIFNQLKSEGNYSNLTDDQIWSEALNTHIGNFGEWSLKKPKGKMKEFADWVRNIFTKIGNYFGIKTNPETSLQTFTDKVIGDLFGGRELISESDQQLQQNEKLKTYLQNKLKLPQNIVEALPKDLSITYKLLMGDPSMTLGERINQTKLAAAETQFTNIEFSKENGNILVEGIGNIRANILSTFKYYLTGSNRINTDIFHELVHTGTLLTMKDIEFYKSSRKYQETNKYTPEQIEAYDNILFYTKYFTKFFKEGRKKRPLGTSLYGLSNEYEFIAEFMSNPKFKQWILDTSNDVELRARKQKKGKIKGGVLRNIWDNIKILLGLKNTEIDRELEAEIDRDISIILKAQKNNLENSVVFRSENKKQTPTIQFSLDSSLNRNIIPKSTFAKIVNSTSKEGKSKGYEELVNSSWFKNLPESKKSDISENNFHNMMLEQAKLIQENDALKQKQIKESEKEKISKINKINKEKIQDIIDNYKQKIIEIKKDVTKNVRDKSLEQRRLLRQAVKDIKSHLSSNIFTGKITPAETNRLIRKASELGTRKDIQTAVNEFIDLYNDIKNKAESRNKQKEFTRDEYDELYSIIKDQKENNIPLNDIIEYIKKSALSNKKSGILNETYLDQINKIYKALDNEKLSPTEAYDQMKEKQNETSKLMADDRTRSQKIKNSIRYFIKYISDRQYLPKKLLQEIGATNTESRIIAMAGSSAQANDIFSQYDDRIFKGLSENDKKQLDSMIIAKRIISIEKNRSERNLAPIEHPYANPEKALEGMKDKIGDKKFDELTDRANEYFKAFKRILTDMKNNGLISEDAYQSMIDIDYQPRLFVDRLLDAQGNLDEDGNFQNFSGQNGGLKSEILKSLKDGSSSAIIDNSEWLLKTAISSRYKAMAMNEVNKRFMTDEFWKAKDEFDLIDPKNFKSKKEERFYNYFKELQSLIKDNPIVGTTEKGNPKYKYDSAPQGFKKAYYYVDGVKNEFFLAEDFHKEWHDVKEGLIFDDKAKGIINKYSGSALIKAMATGYNPTFAFTNTPRDFIQTLVFSPEYSNNILFGTLQLAKDQLKAITRMYKSDFRGKEDEIFNKYIQYGGGMDFLHVQGLIDKENKMKNTVRKVLDSHIFEVATLMKLSKWSEMMTRMAIFERSIKNQLKEIGVKDIENISDQLQKDDIYYKAVASARGIMDFNQGGKLVKDLDAVMPYLNAATQGTRVAIDSFRKNPLETSIRMLQAGGLMASAAIGVSYALLAVARQMGDDEDDKDKSITEIIINTYDGLSQYQRANYINIVMPFKTDKGERYVFKIAKTQFVAPLSYLMEEGLLGVMRKSVNKEEKDFMDVLKETSWVANKNMTPIEIAEPQNFITSVATKNPLLKASLTYVTGYDFFKDELITFDITKSNFPKELEGYKDDNIEDFYKEFGSLTGKSPARTKAFVESIVTTPETNPFITMIYGGADLTNAIVTGDSKTEVAKELKDNIAKVFTKRLIGQSSDFNRMKREKEQVKDEVDKAILRDEKIKIETDILAKKISNGTITGKDISNKFNELNLTGTERQKANERLNKKINSKASDNRIFDIMYSTSNSNRAKAILIKKYFPEVYENTAQGEAIRMELKKFRVFSKGIRQELAEIRKDE